MKQAGTADSIFLRWGCILVLVCASAIPALAQTCVTPPAGMIAWWPMDEEAGFTVADAAGSNPGVHVGAPTHEAGKVGRALRFDGTRSFVAVQDNDLWTFGSSDFTIELWANFATPGGGSVGQPSHVFISHDESPGHANKWFFSLGGGYLNFLVGPTEDFFPLVPFSPEVGRWYHLAVRRFGSTYTIFIDGEPAGSAQDFQPVPKANALLTIGEAEGLFHMNGLLDEVTIYNRGLDDTELRAIFQAGSAGKCKPPKITTRVLTSAQLGQPYEQTLRAEFGTPPYTWSVAGGSLPRGMSLSGAGVLSGTPQETGEFAFVAHLLDARGMTADAPLSLDVLLVPPPPDIRINQVGNIPVPGRTIEYFIVVENVGSTPAINVPVLGAIDPASFLLVSADPTPDGNLEDFVAASVIGWTIPSISPGEFRVLTYRALVRPSLPLGTPVIGGPTCVDKSMIDTFQCVTNTLFALTSSPCRIVRQCVELATIACVHPVTCFVLVGLCTVAATLCANEYYEVIQSCSAAATAALGGCFIVPAYTQGPTDPNEKLVVAKRFVRPEQTLVYPIHFENIGTVEARDVFVTDILDPALDESTLTIVTPQGASFDPATRKLKWSLLNLNLPPGETGNVLFAVKPRQNTPSSTIIRNTATIQFEVFAPLDTNQVETVVDTTPPHCTMGALPPVTLTPDFPLSWSGTDAIGEVDTFTLFVSINGGSSTPFLEKTRDTQTTFHGEVGKTYGFICIATDTAGNVEVKNPVAEVTTQVAADKTPPVITISATPETLWPPDGKMVPVTVSGTMTDSQSGVNASTAAYAVTDKYGLIQPSGKVTLASNGSYTFTIQLQASRNGDDKDGRQYIITVSAQDNAGNKGSAATGVTVPHDQGQ